MNRGQPSVAASLRWRLERVRDLYPNRGLGVWYRRGSTGTTYGDPRSNEFLTVDLLLLAWQFEVSFGWKGRADA